MFHIYVYFIYMRNAFVHVSMLCLYSMFFLGIYIYIYTESIWFSFCVYSSDVISCYNDEIYVVFFVFFGLGTYSSEQAQIAGSTKPLTAQRRRFLHRYYRYYRFHYRVHIRLFVITCMARVRYQRNVSFTCNNSLSHSTFIFMSSCHFIRYKCCRHTEHL